MKSLSVCYRCNKLDGKSIFLKWILKNLSWHHYLSRFGHHSKLPLLKCQSIIAAQFPCFAMRLSQFLLGSFQRSETFLSSSAVQPYGRGRQVIYANTWLFPSLLKEVRGHLPFSFHFDLSSALQFEPFRRQYFVDFFSNLQVQNQTLEMCLICYRIRKIGQQGTKPEFFHLLLSCPFYLPHWLYYPRCHNEASLHRSHQRLLDQRSNLTY